jgi:hypothetical protein
MEALLNNPWKAAVTAPFRSWRSVLRLSTGALFSMPYWWVSVHSGSTLLLWLTTALSFAASGYSVRLIRTAVSASASGAPFVLPSWRGNPKDMLRAIAAGVLGTLSVSLSVGAAIYLLLQLLVFFLTGHFVSWQLLSSRESLLALWPAIQGGQAIYLAVQLTCVAQIGLLLFIPVMVVHYALSPDRLLSVFEWRAIANRIKQHIWSLLSVVLGNILVVAILNAIFHSNFVLLSLIGFAVDVITWALVAQVVTRE